MGKPFNSELLSLEETYKWVVGIEIAETIKYINKDSDNPIIFIGSGGSFSACVLGSYLGDKSGVLCSPKTPLEAVESNNILRDNRIIFISSSGNNNDIIVCFKLVVKSEPRSILNICMRKSSKLELESQNVPFSITHGFEIPSGKDGFLASNSLLAYFVLLLRSFVPEITLPDRLPGHDYRISEKEALEPKKRYHTVLFSSLTKAVAVDIESKFTESALGAVNISDYRNFGHGRHHWFAKYPEDSTIVALITNNDRELAEKTLACLPEEISVIKLTSDLSDENAIIELLVKSFFLVNERGQLLGIDPGRPGVPEFGRKLYNLRYASIINPQFKAQSSDLVVTRKLIGPNQDQKIYSYYKSHLEKFKSDISSTIFGGIAFDYDGTICGSKDRFIGPFEPIVDALTQILNNEVLICIITGRGKSVKRDLLKTKLKGFANKIIIGYYNGAEIGYLSDESVPNNEQSINEALQKYYDEAIALLPESDIIKKLRPNQLTIQSNYERNWKSIRALLFNLYQKSFSNTLKIFESSHSFDVISYEISKNRIINYFNHEASLLGISRNILLIGDKGKWPGNDFELLGNSFSLSVDEVSSDPSHCWNLSKPGIKNEYATLYYLRQIRVTKKGIRINLL
jgi:hydroxymethylpyrimidine pyrophosphatase-like HAD family hydrolase